MPRSRSAKRGAVLLVEVDEHLGVAVRVRKRCPPRLELRAQLGVVVDLAVLDDDDARRPRCAIGWSPRSRSMIDSRRAASPTGAVARPSPAPSGPRWASASLIALERVAVGGARRQRARCRRCRTSSGLRRPRGDARPRRTRDQRAHVVATSMRRYRPHRAVGDVLEVVGELLGPRHVARMPQLREAGQPGRTTSRCQYCGDLLAQLLEERPAGSAAGRRSPCRRAARSTAAAARRAGWRAAARPTRVVSSSVSCVELLAVDTGRGASRRRGAACGACTS